MFNFFCCPFFLSKSPSKIKRMKNKRYGKGWTREKRRKRVMKAARYGKQASGESVNRINKELFDPHTPLKMVLRLSSAPIGWGVCLVPCPTARTAPSAGRSQRWAFWCGPVCCAGTRSAVFLHSILGCAVKQTVSTHYFHLTVWLFTDGPRWGRQAQLHLLV